MTIGKILISLGATLLLSGCMSSTSFVSASPNYSPVIAQSVEKGDSKIGIVIRPKIAGDVVRFIVSKEGLDYQFEFQVGQDFVRTFPSFVGSFAKVTSIVSVEEGRNLDYVLDPTIRGSIQGRIKQSGAPLYELTLNLESPVIKDGKILDRIYVTQVATVDIPAMKNTDELRTTYMRQEYENQLTNLYNEFRIQFRDILKRIRLD